jgi:hypothetical protein
MFGGQQKTQERRFRFSLADKLRLNICELDSYFQRNNGSLCRNEASSGLYGIGRNPRYRPRSFSFRRALIGLFDGVWDGAMIEQSTYNHNANCHLTFLSN